MLGDQDLPEDSDEPLQGKTAHFAGEESKEQSERVTLLEEAAMKDQKKMKLLEQDKVTLDKKNMELAMKIVSLEEELKKNKLVLQTWGVMYCGGKNKLLESLTTVTRQIGLDLHEESFDW